MQMKYLSNGSSRSPSLIRKAGAVVVSVVAAGVALMFSAVLLSVLLVVGAMALAYFWWKTREARKLMRDMQQFHEQNMRMESEMFRREDDKGTVIEGEAIHVDTKRDTP